MSGDSVRAIFEVLPETCFKWTDAILLSHPALDEQHKHLFRIGESLVESLSHSGEHKIAAGQLQAFIGYAQEHFKFEEGLMRAADYPQAERHAKYHASLLTELITNCNKLFWGRHTNHTGLTRFLLDWLVLHIDIADREMVAWLDSPRSGVPGAREGSRQGLPIALG